MVQMAAFQAAQANACQLGQTLEPYVLFQLCACMSAQQCVSAQGNNTYLQHWAALKAKGIVPVLDMVRGTFCT